MRKLASLHIDAVIMVTGIFFAIAVASCSTASEKSKEALAIPPQPEISAEELDKLLAYDFTAGMAEHPLILPSDPAPRQIVPNPLSGVTKKNLTPTDERILGFFDLTGKWPVHWGDTVGRVMVYYGNFGVFPETGVHLFPRLLTKDGYSAFQQLSPAERFAEYAPGVNFASGRFHDSFIDPIWRPGAYCFWPAGTDTLELHGQEISLRDISTPPGSRVAGYRVFGSEQDDYLWETSAAAMPPTTERKRWKPGEGLGLPWEAPAPATAAEPCNCGNDKPGAA